VHEQQRGDGLTEGRIGQFMLLKRKENGNGWKGIAALCSYFIMAKEQNP